jgi:ketosteroid isomerase-like protein
MGARGPHDDFESAKRLIRAAFAHYSLHQDVEFVRDNYVADDIEYVTRHGTFRGPEEWMAESAAQEKRWRMEFELEELIDAGEGAVIAFNEARRINRDTGETEWKTWPAVVLRVHLGRIVFFEGYVDRRRALADYGLEQR